MNGRRRNVRDEREVGRALSTASPLVHQHVAFLDFHGISHTRSPFPVPISRHAERVVRSRERYIRRAALAQNQHPFPLPLLSLPPRVSLLDSSSCGYLYRPLCSPSTTSINAVRTVVLAVRLLAMCVLDESDRRPSLGLTSSLATASSLLGLCARHDRHRPRGCSLCVGAPAAVPTVPTDVANPPYRLFRSSPPRTSLVDVEEVPTGSHPQGVIIITVRESNLQRDTH